MVRLCNIATYNTLGMPIVNRLILRYGNVIFIALALGAVLFANKVDTPTNAGLSDSVKLLALPLALLIFGYTYVNRALLTSLKPSQPWRPWVIAFFLYLLSLGIGWPYYLAINTLAVSEKPIIFSGTVVKKFISTSRVSATPHISIKEQDITDPVTLPVTVEEYSKIEIGSRYSKCYQKGMLGIPFLWRNGSIPYICWVKSKNAFKN